MNFVRIDTSPAVHRRLTYPISSVRRILVSFTLSLAVFFLAALLFAGRSRLLRHAATVKPYAVAYQSPSLGTGAVPTEQELVVFLGDSSVAQTPWTQEGTPPIPNLLQHLFSENLTRSPRVLVSDWSFAGGRLFHYYCLLFEAEKHSPSLVIIPINWRSIGPQSDEWNKAFAFPELSALVPTSERTRRSGEELMRIEGISRFKSLLSAAHRPMLYVTGMKALILSTMVSPPPVAPQTDVLQELPPGEHLIERYSDARLFQQYSAVIREDTASLQALRLIVETAVRRDIKVLFYITPIHLDELRSRASFDIAAFEASLERIRAASSSRATVCLDLSGLLPEEDFLDNYEHYTRDGNTKIALALAPAVEDSLGR